VLKISLSLNSLLRKVCLEEVIKAVNNEHIPVLRTQQGRVNKTATGKQCGFLRVLREYNESNVTDFSFFPVISMESWAGLI